MHLFSHVLLTDAPAVDLVNIDILNASVVALLGYAVVFFGLILLMLVVMVIGKVFVLKDRKAQAAVPAAPAVVAEDAPKPTAPGAAGQLKLYNVEPKTAAMIMAIVADKMGKPLNKLRFLSIKEVE